MPLGYDEVADIVRIIESSACDEFILETNEFKLVLRRRGAGGAANEAPRPAAVASISSGLNGVASSAPAASRIVSAAKAAPAAMGREVRSPMVGTFYRAPSPGAPNFVEIGSAVKKDDPLCIIEVMKLFTTIRAEFAGRVVDIGAENNELVEYGRVLFVIEETG